VAARTERYSAAEAAALALDVRIASVGMWLFLAANAFYYAAWYFAFFYLKALNNNAAWVTKGLTMPSRAYGTVVLVLALVSVAAWALASRATQIRSLAWRLPAVVALVVGLGVVLLQGYEMWHLGFGLTQGGFPSVFAGLTGSWVVEFAAAMFWLGTIIVQARAGGDTVVRPASVTAFVNLLAFLAVVGVINWIVLYFLP
jgi:heme/copper-type cytochrome/quinol oxidase subunit 3